VSVLPKNWYRKQLQSLSLQFLLVANSQQWLPAYSRALPRQDQIRGRCIFLRDCCLQVKRFWHLRWHGKRVHSDIIPF
jgi:hypothetical protein